MSQKNIWRLVGGVLPPIGLSYIAGALDAQGHVVAFIDANAEKLAERAVVDRVKAFKPDLIGVTSNSVNIAYSLGLADYLKKERPSWPIAFGGVHPTVMPEEVLASPAVDFVFRGEGENGVPRLAAGESPESIPGLSYKKDGLPVHNEPAVSQTNLDDYPFPPYHMMPVGLYRPSLGNYKRLPAMGIVSSRGCPGKCVFCFSGSMGQGRVRYRSAENIVEEIELLHTGWNIKEFSFYDDNFTTSRKRVQRFCELVLSKNIDMTWTCSSRVDTVDRELLRLMARSGCHQISFGIESGDPEILKTIRKQINLEQALETIGASRQCGIEPKIFLMLGNPGETEQSIRKTTDFALKSKALGFIISIATPYPGTEFYRWAKENGYLISEDWSIYEAVNGVMRLPTIENSLLISHYKRMQRTLHLQPHFLWHRALKMNTWDEIKKNALGLRAVLGL
jgi:radical SAM superfamily enzyme YgiQ (UPF0313 family)